MVPNELEDLYELWWSDHVHDFDKSTTEGCGLHTEAWVKYAKANGFPKVENLKKNPGQTQYNGHAVDAFLYAVPFSETNSLYQAVDIIGGAEGPNPTYNFGIDQPRYTNADIWIGSSPIPNTVPWKPYNEQGFERLKKMLKHDYERRPQGPDYDVSVWAGRFFHNNNMGPDGTPLSEDAALSRVKGELCQALGISNDGYLGT
jgi:hypothetical protein